MTCGIPIPEVLCDYTVTYFFQIRQLLVAYALIEVDCFMNLVAIYRLELTPQDWEVRK